MNKKRFLFILDFLIVGIVFFLCSIRFVSCEQRFRADVTSYIQDPAADGIYTTARGASLSLPPNELHPLNYHGDTAISKFSEKPVMKPAGEKGTFPVLRTHPRGYKDNGNIPIGTKVTLNRLYLERTVMSLLWNKKLTYALYADLTIHEPYHAHVFCPLMHVDYRSTIPAPQLVNPTTGSPITIPLQKVLDEAPRCSPWE